MNEPLLEKEEAQGMKELVDALDEYVKAHIDVAMMERADFRPNDRRQAGISGQRERRLVNARSELRRLLENVSDPIRTK